jgi:hypothetical protein
MLGIVETSLSASPLDDFNDRDQRERINSRRRNTFGTSAENPGDAQSEPLPSISLSCIAKATWNWVRGKCEEAMREVLGAGRGVQAGEVEIEIPAMAAEAGRETRQGAASDEESDGCDGAQDCNTTY